jgi:DNA-binding transcriptional LysR family regulator
LAKETYRVQWDDRIGRRLKLRDLHILMMVVRSRTMARAAQQLAVSQPVVSKTISDLEHTLGVPLLDRSRNGVEPTLYGQALLKHGIAVFDELRQSIQEIEFLTDPTVGELRIGCTDATAAGLLPILISRLHRRYPRLAFHAVQAPSGVALYRELRERNVELILGRTTIPLAETDLNAELLIDEPLVVVAGRQSRWLRRRKIELSDLINEPWILPPADTAAGAIVRETFQAGGLDPPRAAVLCTSLRMHDILLGSGPYIAMWPASVVQFGARNLSAEVLPVKLPAVRMPLGVITLKGRTISPLAKLFIDCAQKLAEPLANGMAHGRNKKTATRTTRSRLR